MMSAAEHGGGAIEFAELDSDIIESHILTRLDGPTLASTTSASSALNRFCSQTNLWAHICKSTWPSTTTSARVAAVVSDFPGGGPRAFFASSYPVPVAAERSLPRPPPPELISAVDIWYKGELIFTKVEETETVSGWFRCCPLRIDLLDPKDVVPTSIRHPARDDECAGFSDDMTLSWILIDLIGKTSVNLSSHKPVSIQRHWLSGEIQVKYASILPIDHRRPPVQCGIVVTCGASEGGEMQVKEVCMEMEDIDGARILGKDGLVILQRAMEGKKGNGNTRVEVSRKRFSEFLEIKRERKERKLRTESALDIFCLSFGISLFVGFCCFLLCR